MKLLLVRLSSFGDVVHTFPAVTDLRKARPDIAIDWAVEESFAPVAALHPAVATVIPVAHRRLRWPPGRWPALAASFLALRRRLRAGRYDLVLDAQGLMKSAAVARLAGAPVAGLDAASAREPAASRTYARSFAVERNLHAVERTRRLFAAALDYDLAGEGDYGLSRSASSSLPGLERPYVLLVHSASWPSKLWPEERWHRLAERLAASGRSSLLPWGTASEKARAERIAAGIPGARVLPEVLSGGALAALIAGAELSVGLDSGLMHLSAALGVPGIWLYGPTDPGLTGPYGPGQLVIASTDPRAPCRTRDCAHGTRCMDGVDFDRVAAAVGARLAQPRSAGAATS